jgi:hypothetical protein
MIYAHVKVDFGNNVLQLSDIFHFEGKKTLGKMYYRIFR